jgi:hypothetical protein
MSTVTIPLSVITMPIPGSKNAPQRFKGNHVMVKPFLEHYDKLLAVNNVTQDSEQCYAILQYCSIPVREIIEGMASFITPDWTQLKSDILKYFDSALTEERFNEQDLISFIKDTRTLEIHSLETFRRYCRQFIRIGGWLLVSQPLKRFHARAETRTQTKDITTKKRIIAGTSWIAAMQIQEV